MVETLVAALIIFAIFIILKVCGVGAKRVLMKNAGTGQLKNGIYGYSWTYLFFGWWVPLLRGELGVAALHLLFSIVTLGIWQLIVSFLYNAQYTNRLIERGFRFADQTATNQRAGIALHVDLALHQGVASVTA